MKKKKTSHANQRACQMYLNNSFHTKALGLFDSLKSSNMCCNQDQLTKWYPLINSYLKRIQETLIRKNQQMTSNKE